MTNTTTQISPELRFLANPCRSFNFLAVAAIVDPRDGLEKLVLSNFVGGGIGNLIFIELESGDAEVVPLPGDEGAWGLVSYHDEKLIVGTCLNFGYLCSLDLLTRQWEKPVRLEDNTYIWDITIGSDDLVYGGTYPAGVVVRYDPRQNTLYSLGRPSSNPENRYCRPIRGGLPGYVVVGGGYDSSLVAAWNLKTEEWKILAEGKRDQRIEIEEVGPSGVVLRQGGKRQWYDPETLEPGDEAQLSDRNLREDKSDAGSRVMPASLQAFLSDGREVGVQGQEYYISEPNDGAREFRRVPVEPPIASIRSLVLADNGDIWGSCSFGQTIFRYSGKDGEIWNSLSVADRLGEVYGMVFAQGRLYMSCYAGGDHVVYDPEQPWSQRDNLNPKSLESVYPYLARPRANSVLGPDGGIWTGWSATYGTYGGGLTRVDPVTHEMKSWRDPIPGQQVMGISADETFIYFTTNDGGEGLPVKGEPGWFCIWCPHIGMIAKYPLGKGGAVGQVLAVQDYVLVAGKEGLHVFQLAEREFRSTIVVGAPCFRLIAAGGNRVVAICGGSVRLIDFISETVQICAELPEPGYTGVLHPDGTLTVAANASLYQMTIEKNEI